MFVILWNFHLFEKLTVQLHNHSLDLSLNIEFIAYVVLVNLIDFAVVVE